MTQNKRTAYINYLNSHVIKASNFDSAEDMMEYCNITCILSFDFLDMELTAEICQFKWNEHLELQNIIQEVMSTIREYTPPELRNVFNEKIC